MPAAQQGSLKNAPGVRDHYFCFWLCVNLFRLNGNFEGWCPTENVVVHSYISTTKASRELLYSVDLLRIVLFLYGSALSGIVFGANCVLWIIVLRSV